MLPPAGDPVSGRASALLGVARHSPALGGCRLRGVPAGPLMTEMCMELF